MISASIAVACAMACIAAGASSTVAALSHSHSHSHSYSATSPQYGIDAVVQGGYHARNFHSGGARRHSHGVAGRRRRRQRRVDAAELRYRYLQDDADYDVVIDGEGDDGERERRPLRSILDEGKRSSPVIELRSVEDYRSRVLGDTDAVDIDGRRRIDEGGDDDNDVDVVRVIRFSAPWCKACRSTNVAWERMAARIHGASCGRVKFYSVSIDNGVGGGRGGGVGRDGKNSSPIYELKEMLGITRVPVGILHHPTLGISERMVDLDRANMTMLKRTLERYVLDGQMGGLDLDGYTFGGGEGGDGGGGIAP
jgi:hypothetical protein